MSCSVIEMKNGNPCFISQIPEPIIHHIISFLSNKDCAKTCVLSKTWNNFYASRNIMVFHEGDLKVRNTESKTLFMNCIDRSLNRRMEMMYKSLARFELHLKKPQPDRLKEWLQKVFDIGVKTMSLVLGHGDKLFGLIFVSKTLVELHVGCYFFVRACSTINLPNLEVLSLSDIALSDNSLNKLSSGCPMVKILRLSKCHTSRKPQLLGFTTLVELGLCGCKDVKVVEISSPYFETFSFVGAEAPTPIELIGSCEGIRKLELSWWLSIELSTFKFLEEITFTKVCIRGRISSQSVKTLVIKSAESRTKVVEIDCPNLMSFTYETMHRPFIFVSACNPRDFKYELSLLKSSYSEQVNALENLLQSTFFATRNLRVVIAFGRCKGVWEKILSLHKSRIGYACIHSLEKYEWGISPDEQLEYRGSRYKIDGIVLNFD